MSIKLEPVTIETEELFEKPTLKLVETKRKEVEKAYDSTEALREILKVLDKRKFVLDCGHKVTFGYFLGSDVIIRNGKKLRFECTECGY